jgi:hypothetical protein
VEGADGGDRAIGSRPVEDHDRVRVLPVVRVKEETKGRAVREARAVLGWVRVALRISNEAVPGSMKAKASIAHRSMDLGRFDDTSRTTSRALADCRPARRPAIIG